MDRLRDREAYDAATIVHQFLSASTAAEGIPPHEESLVARLCGETVSLFQTIVKHLHHPSTTGEGVSNDLKDVYISLQRSCGRLRLWSDGYGICSGKLDSKFARSQKLRRATLKILASIGETLSLRLSSLVHIESRTFSKAHHDSIQRLNILVEAAQEDADDDESSSDSSSDYGSDSMQEVAEDLKVDTMCLMDLDPIIQNPIPDIEREKSVAAVAHQEWSPQDAYSDRIARRFPKAPETLVSRLGKSNLERYLRCQAQRKIQEKGNDESQVNQLTGMLRSDASSSKFRDSALGSSVPSSASNPDTIMSYHADDEGSVVRIPPLPRAAKAGKPFSCIACGKLLSLRTNSAWKRHLYQDLIPWQCLDKDCSFAATFLNREDWVVHLADEHDFGSSWKETKCPLCLDPIGPGKIPVTRHLSSHLEEISLGALPSEFELDVESDNDDEDSDDRSGSSFAHQSEDFVHKTGGATLKRHLEGRRPHDAPASQEKRSNGLYQNGEWWCNCTPRQRAAHLRVRKYGPAKGLMYHRCVMRPGCNFFMWDDDAQRREHAGLDATGEVQREKPPRQRRNSEIVETEGEAVISDGPFLLTPDSSIGRAAHYLPKHAPSLPKPAPSAGRSFTPGPLPAQDFLKSNEAANTESRSHETADSAVFNGKNCDSPSSIPPRDKAERIDFDYAMAYVDRIKARVNPEMYQGFLKLLQKYEKGDLTISQVQEQVEKLFERAPDLCQDFKDFLPLEL